MLGLAESSRRTPRQPQAIRWTAVALLFAGTLATTGAATGIDPQAYLGHIKFLASDELQGRGNGTRQLDRAADYIASQFRLAGLAPGGDNGTYFQTFEVTTGWTIGRTNSLTLKGPEGSTTLKLGDDYQPLSVASPQDRGPSGRSSLSLPLVFAGYGISAPAYHYDDYAGTDVAGKAVLIFRHEPQENDETSVFQGKTLTAYATFEQKAATARQHGARALLIVEDPAHADQISFANWLRDPEAEEYGLPVLRLSRERAQRIIGSAVDLEEVSRDIDADLHPRSRVLGGTSITYTESLSKTRRPVRNVVGILRGSDSVKAQEAIVLGAHYDHLGLGGRFSLAENAAGQIHNGADDNASGTAAIIEIAKLASANRSKLPRSLVFVTFAGEELGLLGSSYYTNHPVFPQEQTVAMINLDMVGRAHGRIFVSGLDNGPDLAKDLEAAEAGIPLKVTVTSEGSAVGGSSDDTSFVLRRIPAIFFFSGLHADYHRPTDDWEKIDAEGGAAAATMAYALAQRIAERPDRVAFVAPPPQDHTAQGASGAGSGGGYGPYFGSIPDFGESDVPGVKFADVREGSPAARAGFKKDDVLVSFGGTPIATLYDFTFALREKKPGDKIEVVVMRQGKEVRATVELANRP
jgi:Peptidase family M28/PDZ domain/PA domain